VRCGKGSPAGSVDFRFFLRDGNTGSKFESTRSAAGELTLVAAVNVRLASCQLVTIPLTGTGLRCQDCHYLKHGEKKGFFLNGSPEVTWFFDSVVILFPDISLRTQKLLKKEMFPVIGKPFNITAGYPLPVLI
jgi:hypothetical protein